MTITSLSCIIKTVNWVTAHSSLKTLLYYLEPPIVDQLCMYCSRWIAAQQKLPKATDGDCTDGERIEGRSASFQDQEKQIFGCEHYKRNCKLRAACCGKLFTCRFCHDNVSDHSMDR